MTDALEQASQDYRRVEAALAYLHAHREAQPALAEVATHVGLSPYHFQRLFRRWAGVSPKRFLQFLSREHAKTLLARGDSVLDAALKSGISGPGRLHDLFVQTEAVTPGEFRAAGAGLHIGHGIHASPFGPCLVAVTERGVCAVAFVDDDAGAERALAGLARDFPRARLSRAASATGAVASRLFGRAPDDDRGRRDAPLGVLLSGSPFQLRVWQALLEVPEGSVQSYGALARAVGSPGAARAVGSANAANRIAYLIPCHRVIRAIGDSGEYRWGVRRKRLMLAWEQARCLADSEDRDMLASIARSGPTRPAPHKDPMAFAPGATTGAKRNPATG